MIVALYCFLGARSVNEMGVPFVAYSSKGERWKCRKLKLSYLRADPNKKRHCHPWWIFFFLRCYLFIFREGKGERKRERNASVWLPLTPPPNGT